jgi:DNA-3-methyladenine glycosylase II
MATAKKAPAKRAAPANQPVLKRKPATKAAVNPAVKPAAKPAVKRAAKPAPDATKSTSATARDRDAQQLTAVGAEVVRSSRVVAKPGSVEEVGAPVQIGPLAQETVRPDYWERACSDLVKRDRILKKLIPRFGPVHLINRGDPFVTLARSVVGQQISVAAAQAVWYRVVDACPSLAPPHLIELGHAALCACGLSKRKAEYILDLAGHFESGAMHVQDWTTMEDDAVIAELTQIRGIGRWTAEMFLIFNLMRPDILPLDDLGLIRAISLNYFSGEPVTRSEAREVAANWEPWRTVATWYMWRSLDAATP